MPPLLLEPAPARSPARWVADLAQVAYYRPVLLEQVEELQRKGISPAVAVVATDGFGSLTSGVALDPSGEVALPADKRSKAWAATVGQTELGVDGLEA